MQQIEIAIEHKTRGLFEIEAHKADYANGVWTLRSPAGVREVRIPAAEVERIGQFRPAME